MLTSLIVSAVLQPLADESRFELVAPLSLPAVYVHHQLAKYGVAQSTARRLELQGRILWIDATANLGRVNSDEKIRALVEKIDQVGFNTIVFDIKPINGYTMYPSELTEQITHWRAETMTPGYDPLRAFVTECKKRNLPLFVSMNAFSEGHQYAKREEAAETKQFFNPGWGYDHPELQTTRYVPVPTIGGLDVASGLDPASPTTPFANYSDVSKAQGEWFISVERSGVVRWSSSERPDPSLKGLAHIVARTPEAREFLQRFGVGSTITVGSRATYLRSGEAQNQIPLMMNPHDERIQQRALSFVKEVAANYDIDGLLYDDRLRFGGLDTDFSESTRAAFERRIGRSVNWPDDIYTTVYTPSLTPNIRPGRLYDAWLAFRAETMQRWVSRARATLKAIRPTAQFGVYAGSWYGDYPKYGSNYASPDINAGFPFLTYTYRKTGFAQDLDVLITGCYYPYGTVLEAVEHGAPPGRTVEAGGIISNRVARSMSWTYAGIMIADYASNPRGIESALQAAAATTQGVMVFDLSHNIEEFWPVFERAFKNPARAPHQVPGLLDQVRRTRADFDKNGFKEPPFPMFEGAPGAGF